MFHRYHLQILRSSKEWITHNQRLFWAQRAVRTKAWRDETAEIARTLCIPTLKRARVVAMVSFPDQRRRDPGNWAPTAKACVDGLVDALVFEDDDYTHVIGPDMRIGPKTSKADAAIDLLIYPTEKM